MAKTCAAWGKSRYPHCSVLVQMERTSTRPCPLSVGVC
jgi:hypothetical protein